MSHGTFSDDPKTLWHTDPDKPDRKMAVLEDFWFVDPDNHEWRTPADYCVDGASIPRALWTVVGSPYTGDYRRASIVHDKACDDAVGNSIARRAADRMFFHACRAGLCSVREAIVLYLGVRIGALTGLVPAWQYALDDDAPRIERTAAERRIEADFQMAARQILDQGESDDPFDVERRTDLVLSTISGIDLRGR